MPDAFPKSPAMFEPVELQTGQFLCLTEYPQRRIWSVQANRHQDLARFCEALFGRAIDPGAMAGDEDLRLIRLWPHKALLLSTDPVLPTAASEMTSMATEVGHGLCELGLGGSQVFVFLNSYATVDMDAAGISAASCVRGRLGHYPATLWWDDKRDIRVLIDRSLAQSFCDWIGHLAQRWNLTPP